MDRTQTAALIDAARRLATLVEPARAIAQDHKTSETVVMMVCLLTAIVVTDFLTTLLKITRIILYLCLFEGGRRIVSSWRERQRRAMQHASQGEWRISPLEDKQETEHADVAREDGESGG